MFKTTTAHRKKNSFYVLGILFVNKCIVPQKLFSYTAGRLQTV